MAYGEGGACERWSTARPGSSSRTVQPMHLPKDWPGPPAAIRPHRDSCSRRTVLPRALHERISGAVASAVAERRSRDDAAYNRLLVLFFVVSDALISGSSFALAYMLRFHWLTGIIPVTKGSPPFRYYGKLLPFVMAIPAFHAGCLSPPSRAFPVDDFFAVFVGSILAVVFGVGGPSLQHLLRARCVEGPRRTRSRSSCGRSTSSPTSSLRMRHASSFARPWNVDGRLASG